MEDIKETITTKEHYKTYSDLKKGIKEDILLSLVSGLYKDKKELQRKFNEDPNLNNTNMKQIDALNFSVRTILKDKIGYIKDGVKYTALSLSQGCSFIKHILIYNVLKIKPIFEEDILNYNDLYKNWIAQDHKTKYGKGGLCPERYILKNRNKWILK